MDTGGVEQYAERMGSGRYAEYENGGGVSVLSRAMLAQSGAGSSWRSWNEALAVLETEEVWTTGIAWDAWTVN